MEIFITNEQHVLLLEHSYNFWLVSLSFLVATIGSGLALYVSTVAKGFENPRHKLLVELSGAGAFGLAVWSMHFIGMLAFHLCTSVTYDIKVTILSIIPVFMSAWIVLHWGLRENHTFKHLFFVGIVTGSGIGVMHYSGMMAMRMSALLRFNPVDFTASIVVAVVLSMVAMGSRNWLLTNKKLKPKYPDAICAIGMGAAISTMHYVGMHAARFVGSPETTSPIPATNWEFLTLLITTAVLSLLAIVSSGVLLSKLRGSLAAVKIYSLELEAIINNSTEAIITISSTGEIRKINQTFGTLFKYQNTKVAGEHLSTFLPQWALLLRQKTPQGAYETLGKKADGIEFPISVSLTRFGEGSQAIYVGFLTDLSEIKEIQKKLLHDANHDFLTGLYNRRFFEEQLSIEIKRCLRSSSPLALIMLDIDRFKRINDTYGHLSGDHVLALLASELSSQSRKGDVVARYGGEEFIILLANTPLDKAEQIAERLRAQIEKLELNEEDNTITFTVSLGIACLDHSAPRALPERLIGQADKAMYEAKESGRNCVKVYQ